MKIYWYLHKKFHNTKNNDRQVNQYKKQKKIKKQRNTVKKNLSVFFKFGSGRIRSDPKHTSAVPVPAYRRIGMQMTHLMLFYCDLS